MTQKILITGALGYVGGGVSKYLAENLDAFLRLTTISHAKEKPDWIKNGELIFMDVLNSNDINLACRDVDVILHLAAVHEIGCAKNPEEALMVNGLGTLKLLESAKRHSVKRFIYFSTIHVYGSPLMGEITEKTLPFPVGSYAITHRVAEDYVLAAHKLGEIEGAVVRMSNCIGAPVSSDVDRWTIVVNDLCRQAVVDKKLMMRSAGLQYRDFVTLEDVDAAILHLINLPKEKLQDGLFNLGSECLMQIREVVTLIQKRCKVLFGYEPVIEMPAPNASEQPNKLNYNIDKLKSTGFKLTKNIEKAIDATLLFCDVHFKA